ncbi:MAG: peptide ABC transporter substrate-binding protein [Deltaproteobacteria bacterium]|nr:peptide ABC transporter substrate-binding protein [Deltaproteobacteria bacterium]
MDRRAFLRLMAAGALATALPRCGGGASGGRLFRMNLRSEPPTLDPNLATDNVSLRVLTNLMEGLTAYGDGLRPVPAAAERWEVLDGGARVLFHLRPDGRWSDGVPVTARDFEFSWKRFLDPETAAEYAYFLYDVEGAEAYNTAKSGDAAGVGVRALDDLTLEVRLARPVVFFPMITTFMVLFPLRPDVIARHGDAWTEPGHFVGNGPFALEAWRHEYKVSLRRNPHYRAAPRIEGVDFFMVNEPTVELTLFERGDLDFALLPIVEIPRYEESPLFHRKPMLRAEYYGFNCKKLPFNDPRVRRAFSLAIDRSVFPRILHGGETPMASWIPPGMFAHEPDIGLHFDLDAARSALAEAGFAGGRGFPRVDLAVNTGEEPRRVAENMQSQWKESLGVTVRLRNVEWKAYLKEIATDPPGIWRLGWGADYPDPDNFMNLFTAASGNNHTRWGSAEFDRLVADAALDADKSRRKAMYDDAQRILCAEAAAIMPLYSRAHNFLVSPRVEGLWINEMDYLYLDRVSVREEAEA